MKTFMPKAADITRQWYVVDAEGQVFGRVASQVANILRGKNKPIYTPNVDTGDYVIIINADKIVMTGKKLDDVAKLVSTQELTITGELANEIGTMDSTSIVNDLKLMLDETKNMTDDQIKQEIIEIAKQYNVTLTDAQINQLITLCRSLEKLDGDALKSRVEEVQNTLKKVSNAKTQVVGFIQTVKKVVTSVASFFEKIKDIIGL